MFNFVDISIAFMIALVSSFLLTYPVKRFAVWVGAVDFPNYRKIHKEVTPRLGGIAIFLGALLGGLYLFPKHDHMPEIFFGALVILITGAMDDRFDIKPVVKMSGQLIAASFLVSSGLIIERITIPFIGMIDLGFFSVLITVLWVVGITNAINLIDGLDGLATGITTIALISIFIMAVIDGQLIAAYLSIVLIGSNLGFLYHNFYPAKIYMGDTGSNFLGYMVAAISMLGLFKNVAFFSFIVPIIVLAIPIFDTIVSIVRRAYNKENIMAADNKHIHYQLLNAGYSHRKTVLIMYVFGAVFGGLAILFSTVGAKYSVVVTIFVLFFLHIFSELAGIVLGGKRPIIDRLRKMKWKFYKKRDSRDRT